MVGLENEGIMNADLCLPLNERSFRLLIQQYNEEAAAARAVALRNSEDSSSSRADLALAAQYMEDLTRDATRLYKKLQEGGGKDDSLLWTKDDVNTLRMLGFDVRHLDTLMRRDVHTYTSNIHSTQKLHTPNLDALLSVEQKIQELQQKVESLTLENLSLRRAVSKKPHKISTIQNSIYNTSGSLEALTVAFNGLKDAYYKRRDEDSLVQRMREKFALALHDIRVEDRRLRVAGVNQSECPYTVIEDTFRILQSIDACRRVRYCVGNNSNIVEEPVDTAVIQLLNDLDFSFPVHIRRLGPGGDYFIDQHVEIKLIDGQLLVKPKLSTIHHSTSSDVVNKPRYEHLAKYLIHLYSPAMDLEKAAGKDDDDDNVMEQQQEEKKRKQEPGVNNSYDYTRDSDIPFGERIASLKQKQQDLQRTLKSHYEQLRQHQQQLESNLSSSPEVSQLDHVDVVNQVKRMHTEEKPTMVLGSPFSGEDRVAHTLQMLESNGKIPDLSTLSESELRRLKRAALRRQMRTLQGLSGVVSPRLQTHSL
ncbi:uncharacterized protein TM35_000212720 [Trypanosoma theileri]|uniref:Uncharacterized protein n=1 Tax=Trypanosoma theileri TaxID=67003 RepID=A0A1X0NSI9_9TRYP|nr:uncharacterized protein TM35_000212720 [Trypanosoma theileri]ORC87666.1 hypothetical protein TM35_000212720 [Trypanosoma theileri]